MVGFGYDLQKRTRQNCYREFTIEPGPRTKAKLGAEFRFDLY
jgi:hypothetical protein